MKKYKLNPKHNCPGRTESTCVYYEGYLPETSELKKEDCVVISETTEEQYKEIEKLKNNSDLSELDSACIDYQKTNGKILLKEFAKKIDEEVCKIKTNQAKSICDIPLEGCGLDLGGLVTDCGDPISTFGELLQKLINNQNQ